MTLASFLHTENDGRFPMAYPKVFLQTKYEHTHICCHLSNKATRIILVQIVYVPL